MNRTGVFILVLIASATPVWAQNSISLKNTDSTAVLYWWDLPGPWSTPAVFAARSLAAETHPVAPGEAVTETLSSGHAVVAVFVPAGVTLTSVLVGGVILASELPPRGTILVDRPGFAAANRGREISGTLAEWGLDPGVLVLDGRSEDWNGIPALLEWGPGFRPTEGRWPSGWPRFRSLQATDREGALWLRLTYDPLAFPAHPGSLLLSRPGASFEFPLAGGDNRVWELSETGARSVGSRILGPGILEAWVRWDRLPATARTVWSRVPADWVLAIGGDGSPVQTYRLGSFSGGDLP